MRTSPKKIDDYILRILQNGESTYEKRQLNHLTTKICNQESISIDTNFSIIYGWKHLRIKCASFHTPDALYTTECIALINDDGKIENKRTKILELVKGRKSTENITIMNYGHTL